jgi:hypothetical protein
MRCSFDWIWSGVTVQGVHIACTIAQAQEFATSSLHGNVFIQASTAPSAASTATSKEKQKKAKKHKQKNRVTQKMEEKN